MAEAMLLRRGGGVMRELRLLSLPDKTSYVQGEFFSLNGTVVDAVFGGFSVPVDLAALAVTPNRALLPSDTDVTLSLTVGRITKSVTVPITVEALDATLGNNSWAAIARASAAGVASQIWNVGDTKTETIGSRTVRFRIVGFDADELAPSDEQYGSAYNGGTGKAGITFKAIDAFPNNARMNDTAINTAGWDQCVMRTSTLQTDFLSLSSGLRSVIRSVRKNTSAGGYGTRFDNVVICSEDRLFLASAKEIFGAGQAIGAGEEAKTAQYAYYAASGALSSLTENEWLRSPHRPSICSEETHFMSVKTDKTGATSNAANAMFKRLPAFCV